jgi:hypothetical protein
VKKANQDPTAHLFLRLYQTSGEQPDLSNPIGAAIDLGTTTSSTYVPKIANFNPKPQLQGGTLYAFVLSAPGAGGNNAYRAESRLVPSTSPYAGGILYVNVAGTTTFTAQDNRDAVMEIVFSCCPPPQGGCTYSQGYWKNHAEAWPVSSLNLGSNSYDQDELLSILTQPTGGNGLVSLARQLIAAKLAIANGADDTAIATTIASADALIGSKLIPPVGADFVSPSATDALTQTLDDYNNGLIGPGHCPN